MSGWEGWAVHGVAGAVDLCCGGNEWVGGIGGTYCSRRLIRVAEK